MRSSLTSAFACSAFAALISLVGFTGPARADVVMPPPTHCPPGQVGVTSHGGPRCEVEAPKDCPTGWHGQLGGVCALRPCSQKNQCMDNEECVEHAVCVEPFEDPFYDYDEEPRDGVPGSLFGATAGDMGGRLLAGPMRPRKPRPTPIVRYNAMNLCGAKVGCASPRTCQDEKLCVPKGQRAVPYSGTNIRGTRVARTSTTPLTSSQAKSNPDASDPVTTTPSATGSASAVSITETTPSSAPPQSTSSRGGCAGCSSTNTGANDAVMGLVFVGAIGAIAARARRR